MQKFKLKLNGISGFTLLEALIAMVLAGIVTTAIFKVYVNQHENWNQQEEIIDMQQNVRAAIGELTRQIRMAGFGLPLQVDGIEAYDSNPDTLIVNYANGDDNATVEYSMSSISSEIRCDGHDLSFFHPGQWAYIFNPDSGGGEFFEVSQVLSGPSRLQHSTMDLSEAYASGSVVMLLNRVKFFLDNSDTLHPSLMMQLPGQAAQVYAENITDLQFYYVMKNRAVVAQPAIPEDVREVVVTITARTDKADAEIAGQPYRTRTITSAVNVRNLDI